ncbi:MAG: hypothetical protein ABIW48_05200 [Burkholderiales bacterium]
MSKSLVVARSKAHFHQSGLCYYCGLPTCLNNSSEFASKYDRSLPQGKRLLCTAEHLQARKKEAQIRNLTSLRLAGLVIKEDIAAKNQPRQACTKNLCKRVRLGRWHDPQILPKFV